MVDFSNLKGKPLVQQKELLKGIIYNNRKVLFVRIVPLNIKKNKLNITTKCLICGDIHTYNRLTDFKNSKQCKKCFLKQLPRIKIYIGLSNSRNDRVVDSYKPFIVKCLKCNHKVYYKNRNIYNLELHCTKCNPTIKKNFYLNKQKKVIAEKINFGIKQGIRVGNYILKSLPRYHYDKVKIQCIYCGVIKEYSYNLIHRYLTNKTAPKFTQCRNCMLLNKRHKIRT